MISMKSSKVNIGLALSRNYDKVSIEILDEPIEHKDDEEFSAEVKRIFKRLREEVEHQFGKIQGGSQ